MNVTKTLEKLLVYRLELRKSKLLAQTIAAFELAPKFSRIRCLALGSPCDSKPALYQLGYILELAEYLGVTDEDISFYDPVFNENDKEVLKLWSIEESYTPKNIDTTLFFLPHAGLDLTEVILNENRPRWMLANNLITHTERLSQQKLHDTYETISTLVKVMENKQEVKKTDEFVTVKKKRNKKYVFTEPEIVYDYDKVYFSSFKMTVLTSDIGENAFTDLSFQHIVAKEVEDLSEKLDKTL